MTGLIPKSRQNWNADGCDPLDRTGRSSGHATSGLVVASRLHWCSMNWISEIPYAWAKLSGRSWER